MLEFSVCNLFLRKNWRREDQLSLQSITFWIAAQPSTLNINMCICSCQAASLAITRQHYSRVPHHSSGVGISHSNISGDFCREGMLWHREWWSYYWSMKNLPRGIKMYFLFNILVHSDIQRQISGLNSFFFFFLMHIFIFGCVGSSFLCEGFL